MSNQHRKQHPRAPRAIAEETFWNGQPCRARIVRVRVAQNARTAGWVTRMEGTVREAVEIRFNGRTFYIDNPNGDGWAKITKGEGTFRWSHRVLPVAEVIEEVRS